MAGSPTKLTVDRQNKKLISVNGTVGSMPDLFQSNIVTLQVQIFDPTGPTSLSAPTIVDAGTYGLRASVGATPAGTTGEIPVALQDTFTWDAVNKWFTADLALNTSGVDALIGAAPSVLAYFELNLTIAGCRNTILQTTFNLRAVVDELAGTVPTPTDQYLTKAECLALFAKYINDAGRTITLTSPITGKLIELGANDDGTFMADSI